MVEEKQGLETERDVENEKKEIRERLEKMIEKKKHVK